MTQILDPTLCRPRYPAQSRVIPNLYDSLKANGQIVPALVRPLPPDPAAGPTPPTYEIICGHRRHATILHLRRNGIEIPFLADIQPLSDIDAFRLADIDNRERADISAHQRGQTYAHALHSLHAGNQRALAAQLGLDHSTVSRYLALVALPEIVQRAFYDRDAITVAHARALGPLLGTLQTADRLTIAAKSIAGQQSLRRMEGRKLILADTVLARLLKAANPTPSQATHAVHDQKGALVARGTRAASGAIALHIPAPRKRSPKPPDSAALIAAFQEILLKIQED